MTLMKDVAKTTLRENQASKCVCVCTDWTALY
jgi:hypothetical protein